MNIVPLDPDNQPALLRFWRAYQEFYRVTDIDDARNQAHVEFIRNSPALGRIHLAVVDAEPVGFSTLYFSFASSRSCRIALLNDLFVAPAHRRRGLGGALIDHAIALARREGIRYVRWSTEASNTDAQKLYQKYAEATDWRMYSVDVTKG